LNEAHVCLRKGIEGSFRIIRNTNDPVQDIIDFIKSKTVVETRGEKR